MQSLRLISRNGTHVRIVSHSHVDFSVSQQIPDITESESSYLSLDEKLEVDEFKKKK